MVGREGLARRIFPPKSTARICDLTQSGDAFDPVGEVVKRARTTRIVILNEAHHKTWHRGLLEDVAVALRREGYSIFAAETFRPAVAEDRKPYPKLSDGFYTQEPGFGEALRRVLQVGFQLVPYEQELTRAEAEALRSRAGAPALEQSLADVSAREDAQARNLMTRIFNQDKTSKVLIYVGWSHAEEAPTGLLDRPELWTEWMASRLKRMSSIDPLTIDVTEFRTPRNRAVVCDVSGTAKRCFITDMAVALPGPRIHRGRLDWRLRRGYKFADIPASARDADKWTIVEARYASEPEDTVPADRVLVGPGENIPLMFKPGAYRVDGWTREHGWIGQPQDLSVK